MRLFAELRHAAFGSTLSEPKYTKIQLKRKGASLPDGHHLILGNKFCPNFDTNSTTTTSTRETSLEMCVFVFKLSVVVSQSVVLLVFNRKEEIFSGLGFH